MHRKLLEAIQELRIVVSVSAMTDVGIGIGVKTKPDADDIVDVVDDADAASTLKE